MAQPKRKLSASAGRGLRERLEAAGFQFKTAPHAAWTANGPGVSVTLYESGTLLVQGKTADDFTSTYLEEADIVSASSSNKLDLVTEPVCGSDETGKGDYFGPLVVAAMVVTPPDAAILRELGVRDSKTIGDAEALALSDQIEEAWPGRFEVVSIGPATYNKLYEDMGRNLNKLLAWAHAKAIAAAVSRTPCKLAVVDKFADDSLVRNAVEKTGLVIKLQQRPRAESHPAVAAASVLARARFLRELRRLGEQHGTRLHKGAGSPVDVIAKDIFRREGAQGLAQVAKMHFKSTQKAMS